MVADQRRIQLASAAELLERADRAIAGVPLP
jgi:hypothetical protein